MRDRMERLVGLPFSIGCVSQSSVAVSQSQPRKSSSETPPPRNRATSSEGRTKSPSFTLIPIPRPPRPNISAGFHKLIKSIKSLSQLFVYRDEDEEAEMEIGLPTDVQHVGHIGWDGFNDAGAMKSWEVKAPGFLPLPSLSLKQFELAMAAQAHRGGA